MFFLCQIGALNLKNVLDRENNFTRKTSPDDRRYKISSEKGHSSNVGVTGSTSRKKVAAPDGVGRFIKLAAQNREVFQSALCTIKVLRLV